MKEIILHGKHGTGKVAIIDDDMYEYLNQWRWCASNRNGYIYAIRSIYTGNYKHKTILMHREVMNSATSEDIIDHKDHDGLNNQRDNLRTATKSQNMANRKKKKGKWASGYIGVHKNYTAWQAMTQKDKKCYTKRYQTEIEAALGYNLMATTLHGEFAAVNIIPKEEMEKHMKYIKEKYNL